MANDLRPVVLAAAEAALAELRSPSRPRRPRLPARRALLLGAGAATAARLAMRLRGGSVLEGLEHRLLEYEQRHFGDDERFDDPEEADVEDEDDDDDKSADEGEDEDYDEDAEDASSEADRVRA
jgi:hypothetical protein